MSDNKHLYTSNYLSLNQAHSYTLLLQVSANRFNYAIVANNELLALGEDYSIDELRDPQQLRDILTANYNKVIIGLHATGLTLFPKALFDDTRIADVARLLDVNDNEKVTAQELDDKNIIIYKVNEELIYPLNNLDKQKTFNSDAGWVKAIARNYPATNDVYLHISLNRLSVLNFTGQRLRFLNTFTFNNREELAYFCALATTELNIQPGDAKLILSGDINNTDSYFTYLQEFFGEVKLNTTEVLNIPAGVQPHKILGLAALLLCVSSEEN